MLHGNTDTGILREACNQAGIPPEVLEAHTAAILEAMGKAVAEQRHAMDLVACLAWKTLCAIWRQRGALLGVATGNLEVIGWIKVEQAGLREWFRFGGFSDQFPDPLRTDRARCGQGPRDGRRRCTRLRRGRHAARYRSRTRQFPARDRRRNRALQF